MHLATKPRLSISLTERRKIWTRDDFGISDNDIRRREFNKQLSFSANDVDLHFSSSIRMIFIHYLLTFVFILINTQTPSVVFIFAQ